MSAFSMAYAAMKGVFEKDQFMSPGNPASSARHGEGGKLLNASDNLHCDPHGNFLAIGEGDVIVSLIELLGRLLGPFDDWRGRPLLLRALTSCCSWLTTRPFRISCRCLRPHASRHRRSCMDIAVAS